MLISDPDLFLRVGFGSTIELWTCPGENYPSPAEYAHNLCRQTWWLFSTDYFFILLLTFTALLTDYVGWLCSKENSLKGV